MTALLAQSKVHASDLINGLIAECAEAVNDREAEALALAALWLINGDDVRAAFAEARALRKPPAKANAPLKPAAASSEFRRRRFDDLRPKPRAETETRLDVGPPSETEAAQRVIGDSDFASRLGAAISEHEAPPTTEADPAAMGADVANESSQPNAREQFRLDEETDQPVLSKAAPMDNARAFARDRLCKGGILATYYFHGDWWQWNGQFYEVAPADRIAGSVYGYLDRALVRTANGEERFRPKPENADALIKCLKACVAIDDRDAPPRWLNVCDAGEPAAENLLTFRNCLVDVNTNKIAELTPRFWAHGGLDFSFDPGARCPRWQRFLEEAFPGDDESQMTVEEQLGYGMTNDTRFEKGALWVGQKRSGKSTLAWVQERLAGVGACVSLSFHDWMKTENSREHLIGKKVGVFADVRFKPAKAYGLTGYDPGGIDYQSAQLLLNIIGRDKVSLGRKFKKAWEGRLFLKVIITSNEVPNLQDAGGVLTSRFIMLDFQQSFFGREDVTLRDQLESELPGIANRCLAAYRRLCARGRFIQPANGRALMQKVEEKVSPYLAFMSECFVEEPEGKGVSVSRFFDIFQAWCREMRRHDLIATTTKSNLIQEVTKIERWKWLRSSKPHAEPRRYFGIKPRSDRHDL